MRAYNIQCSIPNEVWLVNKQLVISQMESVNEIVSTDVFKIQQTR